jgi:methionine-rich copper-binding protein CopC
MRKDFLHKAVAGADAAPKTRWQVRRNTAPANTSPTAETWQAVEKERRLRGGEGTLAGTTGCPRPTIQTRKAADMRQTIRLLALAGALAFGFAGAAFAHAHLTKSTPAAGSTLAAAPNEIDLTFSEDVNLKFTGIRLTGADGKDVAIGAGSLKDKDTTLMVPLTGMLGPGTCTVDWHALSKDGHKTSGTFTFTVQP